MSISQERDLLKLPVNTANALRSSEAQIITKASAFLHICLKREHLKLAVAVAFAFALAKVLRTEYQKNDHDHIQDLLSLKHCTLFPLSLKKNNSSKLTVKSSAPHLMDYLFISCSFNKRYSSRTLAAASNSMFFACKYICFSRVLMCFTNSCVDQCIYSGLGSATAALRFP